MKTSNIKMSMLMPLNWFRKTIIQFESPCKYVCIQIHTYLFLYCHCPLPIAILISEYFLTRVAECILRKIICMNLLLFDLMAVMTNKFPMEPIIINIVYEMINM